MTNHETPARDALMQAHVALAAQAGRDQAELARLRAVVARIAQMTDHWERQLPEVIRTPAVVSAIRAALEPAEPVCKFEQGCHRVVPCDPGCAAPAAVSVPPPATRANDRAAVLHEAADALENDSWSRRDRWGRYEREEHEAGFRNAAELLRRMADEPAVSGPCVAGEQQNETPEAEAPTCPDREPLISVQCSKESGHEGPHSDRPGRIWYPVPAAEALDPRPEPDEPASTCTCGDAGDAFVPLGHYRDCPDAAGVRQDGAQP